MSSRDDSKRGGHTSGQRWCRVIRDAREHGGFSLTDVACAGNWQTCAVGERSERLRAIAATLGRRLLSDNLGSPQAEYNSPGDGDRRLAELGVRFYEEVMANQYDAATKTLNAIERRTQTLEAEAAKAAKAAGDPDPQRDRGANAAAGGRGGAAARRGPGEVVNEARRPAKVRRSR